MPNTKISDLNETTAVADDDEFPLVDTSETETRRVTGANLADYVAKEPADNIYVDTVNEKTPANGVDVDGLNIKDGALTTANAVVAAVMAANAVTTASLKAGTGSVSGGTLSAHVYFAMQDYCFFPSMYCTSTSFFSPHAGNVAGATYVGRFSAYLLTTGQTYSIYWRYLTASDQPFIYALQDKTTGELFQLWMCDDPPPGYWGLDERPSDFVPPIIMEDTDGVVITAYEEIILFKQEKGLLKLVENKAKKDKKTPCEIFNIEFDYDKKTKLFKSKKAH